VDDTNRQLAQRNNLRWPLAEVQDKPLKAIIVFGVPAILLALRAVAIALPWRPW